MDTITILQLILIIQLILAILIAIVFYRLKATDKKVDDLIDTHKVDDRFMNSRFDSLTDFLTGIDKRIITTQSNTDILKDASIVIHKKGLNGSEKGDKDNV